MVLVVYDFEIRTVAVLPTMQRTEIDETRDVCRLRNAYRLQRALPFGN
jgi:hypothetical protein